MSTVALTVGMLHELTKVKIFSFCVSNFRLRRSVFDRFSFITLQQPQKEVMSNGIHRLRTYGRLRLNMDCTCGSFLRRNASGIAAADGNGDGTTMMDASFVHLPPSLMVQQADTGDKYGHQHHINPQHVEFLEGIVHQTASSDLCLLCVERYN